MYLYDLFHIVLLPLQTYGSMECMYVFITKEGMTVQMFLGVYSLVF